MFLKFFIHGIGREEIAELIIKELSSSKKLLTIFNKDLGTKKSKST